MSRHPASRPSAAARFGRLLLLFAALLARFPAPAAHAADSIRFTEYDLPNGLHVILAPEHSAPVVGSYVLYHVGSKDERPDRTGFAHFFEHLMFEGSENIARGELDRYVNAAGGNLNASTSFDETNYHLNLPANQLGLALWIESERMLHAKIDRGRRGDPAAGGEGGAPPALRQPALRGVVRGNGQARLRGDALRLGAHRQRAVYRRGHHRKSSGSFYRTYYLPNNATLVLAGDLDGGID